MGGRTIALAALLMLGSLMPPAFAQVAEGQWQGVLGTAGRIALDIRRTPGGYDGQIEAVDQSPERRPVTDLIVDGDRLSFRLPFVDGHFDGKWDAAVQGWSGRWKQRGGEARLVLTRGSPEPLPVVAGLDGVWDGAVAAGTAKLRLVLHVRTGPRGTLVKLDSPDQLAAGLPVSGLVRDGVAVRFVLDRANAHYAGNLSGDGTTMSGAWHQLGQISPLTFTRRGAATRPVARRPQTPVRPYPYREVEAQFVNPSAAGVRLAGTLTLPAGAGPFPAAVLISGSGGQDRDSTIFGHKPFLVLADYLTRRGIAVLRVDDRGVAASSGSRENATSADYATDVSAAIGWLRTNAQIDPARIGLIGMSEGGVIAPMVAAADRRIAFSVLLAGPAGPGDALWLAQQRSLGLTMGATETELDRREPLMRHLLAAIRGAPDRKSAQDRARAVLAEVPEAERLPAAAVDALVDQLSSDWMRFFLTYDSTSALAKLRSPLLALNGSKDVQVDAATNLAAIRAASKANPDVTAEEIPGLNHLFQTAPTGAIGEYADIEETFASAALERIGQWIAARTGKKRGQF